MKGQGEFEKRKGHEITARSRSIKYALRRTEFFHGKLKDDSNGSRQTRRLREFEPVCTERANDHCQTGVHRLRARTRMVHRSRHKWHNRALCNSFDVPTNSILSLCRCAAFYLPLCFARCAKICSTIRSIWSHPFLSSLRLDGG